MARKKTKQGGNAKTIILAVLLGSALMLAIVLAAKVVLNDRENVQQTTTTQESTTTTIPTAITSNETAKTGDVVEVDYTIRYPDGTLVDTSLEDVAMNEGTYSPLKEYTPIVITIGLGEVVPGVESALVGMKVGDEKTVTITPQNGYGEWSPENLEKLPRIQNTSRVEEVDVDVFENTTGQKPVAGTTIRLPDMKWSIDILEIRGNQTVIRHNPENGTVVATMFGNASLTVTDDRIYSRLDVKPGDRVLTEVGYLTVVNVSDTTLTVDANHELAGKTATFTIKLVSINEATDSYAEYLQQMMATMQEQQQ